MLKSRKNVERCEQMLTNTIRCSRLTVHSSGICFSCRKKLNDAPVGLSER